MSALADPPAAPIPTIEPVWLVEATYAPDGAESRTPFRSAHLAKLGEQIAAGVVIEAGAFADVSSSLMLVRAETEEEALGIFREDIYLRNGVWVELRARRFGRVRLPGVDDPV